MKTDRTLTDTRPSVQKARRLLLSILFENELTDGHFEIFQILYNKLNLFDNKRVYCTIKIPKVAEGNPKSCMRNFPIIADAFGISLRPQ